MVEAAGLGRALLAAASDLTTLGREFALVGGLAVSARAEVRFTRDVDRAVAVKDDSDAEELVLARRSVELAASAGSMGLSVTACVGGVEPSRREALAEP